jgi:polyisoprenoid-binding protein YceI
MKTAFLALALSLLTAPAAFAKDATQQIDPAKSTIKWYGKKVIGPGAHEGKVRVQSGSVQTVDGKPKSAEVVADMASITDEDLTDKTFNDKLTGHLKSDDFFDVEKFPTATIKVESLTETKPGEYDAKGTLTIKGKSAPVAFKAVETKGKDGNVVKTTLTVDRTAHDVRYGSGKFFQGLGDKMIADEFKLEVELFVKADEITAQK